MTKYNSAMGPLGLIDGRSGFTLVETLVAGTIAVVIATVIVTIFNLFHTQVNQSTLRAKMQMDYDGTSQAIGAKVHAAKWVLAFDESSSQTFTAGRDVDSVMMVDPDGNPFAYFIIGPDNILRESANGTTWKNFAPGSRTVQLTPGSFFSLSQNRKALTLNLNLVATYFGQTDSLIVQGDRYLCRNN